MSLTLHDLPEPDRLEVKCIGRMFLDYDTTPWSVYFGNIWSIGLY